MYADPQTPVVPDLLIAHQNLRDSLPEVLHASLRDSPQLSLFS